MCNHHDAEHFPSDVKIEIATTVYQSRILKLLPEEHTLETSFLDVFTRFRNNHNLAKEEHQKSIENAVGALIEKGYITSARENDVYKIAITEEGKTARKSFLSKLFSVFSK